MTFLQLRIEAINKCLQIPVWHDLDGYAIGSILYTAPWPIPHPQSKAVNKPLRQHVYQTKQIQHQAPLTI